MGKSEDFTISNVQLKCDLIDLDNTLDNEYTQYLLNGKKLPIHFTALTSASQVITAIQSNVNVSRSLTRLKSVFVSLYMSDAPGGTQSASNKEVNYFWHPMGSTKYVHGQEIEFQLQVGSKLFPEYPIRSLPEAFYQLRKAIGLHYGNEEMNLVQRSYRDHKYVIGLDLEKVLGASFTGYNAKSGDMITLKLKEANGSGNITFAADKTYKLFYTLSYDSIMNISLTGVEILE